MEYPLGANIEFRGLQAHHCSGIQKPSLRHPWSMRVLKSADTAQAEVFSRASIEPFAHPPTTRAWSRQRATWRCRAANARANFSSETFFSVSKLRSKFARAKGN